MNINPGGCQRKMQDTLWEGQVQKMVDSNGTSEGIKQILWRGVDVRGMKADDTVGGKRNATLALQNSIPYLLPITEREMGRSSLGCYACTTP